MSEIGQARYSETEPRQELTLDALHNRNELVDVSKRDKFQVVRALREAFPRETAIAEHERHIDFAGPGKHLSEAERILSIQMVEMEQQRNQCHDPAERSWMDGELLRLNERRGEIRVGPRPPKLPRLIGPR